jgi:hypothetical protein
LYVENSKDPETGRRPLYTFSSNSLSGNERNRLFFRHDGGDFADVSLVSGTDNTADGRSFALLDFDRDGWTDIAMMSLNEPRFRLYRNRLGDIYPERKPFRYRLVGGHAESKSTGESGNRDAIGAKVLLTFKSGKKQLMHKQGGEGFATQNSEVQSIGVSEGDQIEKLTVRWPSGKKSIVTKIEPDKIMTIRESD